MLPASFFGGVVDDTLSVRSPLGAFAMSATETPLMWFTPSPYGVSFRGLRRRCDWDGGRDESRRREKLARENLSAMRRLPGTRTTAPCRRDRRRLSTFDSR
jgi:hypothetical protein